MRRAPPLATVNPFKPKPKINLATAPYEAPTLLPNDLTALGFRLVHYADSSVAVSSLWGCSDQSADFFTIVRTARNIVGFIRWVQQKQQEEQTHASHT